MNTKGWTYGAEHELVDWDRRKGIPQGFKLDERDVTMVNSNGIAVDPKGELYPYGGEFNTPPTDTPAGQADCLRRILLMHPQATVNYRSNLHVHVRVPKLGENLALLKQLACFNDQWLRQLLPLVEPIPEPNHAAYPNEEEYQGARKRWRRRRRSHHTVLPAPLFLRQQTASTVQEFHDFGVPWSREGKPLPYCQPRCAVNVRQLLETDTIEFRHFPGTLDPDELLTAVEWCRDWLKSALDPKEPLPSTRFVVNYRGRAFPCFPPYVHWMEIRYQQTIHDGSVPREDRIKLIDAFTGGGYLEDPSTVSW